MALPTGREFERREFPEVGLSMLVRPGIAAKAYDDGANGAAIQLVYERAFEDGGSYTVQIAKAFDFERPDLTVAKHKRWLLEHSEREDIELRLEDADALVYEATEPTVGRSCTGWAVRAVGGALWHGELDDRSAEISGSRTRRYKLPANSCLDLVVMVRSLAALDKPGPESR